MDLKLKLPNFWLELPQNKFLLICKRPMSFGIQSRKTYGLTLYWQLPASSSIKEYNQDKATSLRTSSKSRTVMEPSLKWLKWKTPGNKLITPKDIQANIVNLIRTPKMKPLSIYNMSTSSNLESFIWVSMTLRMHLNTILWSMSIRTGKIHSLKRDKLWTRKIIDLTLLSLMKCLLLNS